METSRLPRVERWLLWPLLCAYAFSVHFGNLFRVSQEESVPGLSTLIALLIIIAGVTRALPVLVREPFVLWILLMITWSGVAGAFVLEDAMAVSIDAGYLFGYLLMACTVAGMGMDGPWLRRFWMVMFLALGVSGGLTIIDYLGIVDIPFNNERGLVTAVGAQEVEQAAGFFPRRSAMAAVFSISITAAFVMVLVEEHTIRRLFIAGAGAVGLVCLLLTHNRSGVLSTAIVLALFVAISGRFRLAKRFRIALVAAALGALILVVMYLYFPQHLAVYAEKLAYLNPFSEAEVKETDYGRILILKTALGSLLDNPLGNGFSRIDVPGLGPINPHNIVTAIIWATGILSLVWVPVTGSFLWSHVRRAIGRRVGRMQPIYVDAVVVAIGAWLLNNMTHYSLSTGLAWLLLGMLLVASRTGSRIRAGRGMQSNQTVQDRQPLTASGT